MRSAFRWPRLACLLVLAVSSSALSWSAEAHAERVKLLTFEGDRATPLRWRVAQVLRRAGHTVLHIPPPNDPGSSAELRSYAAEQRVDVFISAVAREADDGWELALRLQNPEGKALGSPVTFRANTLGALVKELKGNGQVRLDRAMRGAPPSRAARSVVEAAEASLEGAEQSWDADGDERPPAAVAKAKPAKTKARAAQAGPPIAEPESEPQPEPEPETKERGRAAYLRFAMAGAAAAPPPATKRAAAPKRAGKRAPQKPAPVAKRASPPPAAPEEVDLDAATSDALEEGASPSPPPETVLTEKTVRAEKAVAAETVLDADADLEPTSGASEEASASADEPEEERRPTQEEEESASAAAVVASVDASLDAAEQTPSDRGVDGSDSRDLEEAPVVVAAVQVGLLRRTLTYVDDLYGRLRAPTTNGWVYRADAAFFPFAKPLKSRLALVGSYEGAFTGAVVDDRTEQTYDVTFSELAGGLRYRQPLGAHELGLRASVGHMSAGLDDPQGLSGVPEFSYTYITPSVDVDLHFGNISLQAELGYRHSVGDFGEAGKSPWFPHMEGYGVDTKLGFEYRFSKQVAFVLSGTLRRFVLEMNAVPDDASAGSGEVAAGAVDQYLAGYSGLQLTL